MDKIIGQQIARYQSDLLAAYCAEVGNIGIMPLANLGLLCYDLCAG